MQKKFLNRTLGVFLCLAMILSFLPAMSVPATAADATIATQELSNWKIAPSAASSASLSSVPVIANLAAAQGSKAGWVDAVAPSTVLGNLIDAGIYDNLFAADNDGNKEVFFADNMSKIPMSDFDNPWWYATSFTMPALAAGERVNINLQGLSWQAEIWVNGTQLTNKNINVSAVDLNNTSLATAGLVGNDSTAYPNDTANYGSSHYGTMHDYPNSANAYDTYSKLFLGALRHYDVDITDAIVAGSNEIIIKITKPAYKALSDSDNANGGDFSYFWVDWNPQPADSNMGLTGKISVSISGAVRLSNPAAASKVTPALGSADMNFYVDLNNMTNAPVTGILTGVIKDPNGAAVATLTSNSITVPANAYCYEAALTTTIANPKLWWPNQYGDQPLYHIEYTFTASGGISDIFTHRFGIREITYEINRSAKVSGNDGYMMQVYVNHVPVVLKGGGYCPTDLYLRHSERANKAVAEYIVYMGMNMVRDEGKFFDSDLLDLFDEYGILNTTGWCCCDRHQNSGTWHKSERFISYESLYSQVRNLRSHASAGAWYNGSDAPPKPQVEYRYHDIEAKLHWTEVGTIISSGVSGDLNMFGVRSGTHMDSTYDTQTPNFYYTDTRGNFGFVSEGGGGAGIPVMEAINKTIPKTNQWPYNTGENANIWNYHASRQNFNTFSQVSFMIDNTYGASKTIEEFITRAQLLDYDGQRAQYEAITLFRFKDTAGVVNWMLNNAWPIFYWNQFDFYLNPHGSTYGAAKGNEPVHIMYNTYEKTVHVLNNTRETYNGLTAELTVYNIDGEIINKPLAKSFNLAPVGAPVPTGTSEKQIGYNYVDGVREDVMFDYGGYIAESYGIEDVWSYDEIMDSLIRPTSDVYFLRLELKDSSDKVISYNAYAEGMRSDVPGAAHTWSRSSIFQTADLTQLNQLSPVVLDAVQASSVTTNGKVVQTLNITNPSDDVAFAVELKAYTNGYKKDLVAPVIYSDNLFTLFPGETRTITVTHNTSDLNGNAVINVNCYNNIIMAGSQRAASNIYAGVDILSTSSTNNLARGATVTSSGLGTSNTARAADAATSAGLTMALNGHTFVDANLNTVFTSTNDAEGSITVNLGSVQTFDRVITRWVQSANTVIINNRPNNVKLEVSDNNSTWTDLGTYNNTVTASTMVDVVLNSTATGQYIRITPSGRRAASLAVGDVTGQYPRISGNIGGGIGAVAAPRAYSISSIEIYAFNNTAFLDILGEGTVTVGSRNYTSNMNANQRVAKINTDGSLTLTITPDDPGALCKVLKGVEDVTSDVLSGVLSLTSLIGNTDITVRFGSFTATYDSKSGSDVAGSPFTVIIGDKLNEPANPTRFGYTFDGWYKDSAYVEAWDFDTDTVTADITLYAKWNEIVGNGGGDGVGVPPISTEKPNEEGTDTVTLSDGTVVTTTTRKDGIIVVTTTTPAGKVTSDVTVPASNSGATITIPVNNIAYGNVAYVVKPDGTKELIKKSYVNASGILVPVTTSGKIEIANNAKPFSDVANTAWYANAVAFVSSHELFQGTADGIFSPGLPMNRAMLVTVLHRLENEPNSSSQTFADVPANSWFADSTSWAADTEIVLGVGENRFDPYANITRESVVVMLYRYAQHIGMDTSGRANIDRFSDASSVSSWAKDAMAWGVHAGIIQGNDSNMLNPLGNASRVEVATTIMRLVEVFYK